MKIEKLKMTDKTITCLVYLQDKLLEIKVSKSKWMSTFLLLKKELQNKQVVFIYDFAEKIFHIENIENFELKGVYTPIDFLVYLGVKVPDRKRRNNIKTILRKRK